jgi:hypothetical protein
MQNFGGGNLFRNGQLEDREGDVRIISNVS